MRLQLTLRLWRQKQPRETIYAAIGFNLGALGSSGCFARVRVSGNKAAVQIKAKMLYDR